MLNTHSHTLAHTHTYTQILLRKYYLLRPPRSLRASVATITWGGPRSSCRHGDPRLEPTLGPLSLLGLSSLVLGARVRSPHRSQLLPGQAQLLDTWTSVCPRPQHCVGGQSTHTAMLGRAEAFRLQSKEPGSQRKWTPMRPSEASSTHPERKGTIDYPLNLCACTHTYTHTHVHIEKMLRNPYHSHRHTVPVLSSQRPLGICN